MEPLTDTALVLVTVIPLEDEWLGYDPRHLSEDALNRAIHASERDAPSTHRQLLEERRRRRERWRKVEE